MFFEPAITSCWTVSLINNLSKIFSCIHLIFTLGSQLIFVKNIMICFNLKHMECVLSGWEWVCFRKIHKTEDSKMELWPWLGWLSGWGTSLQSERSPVQFPVREHAWIMSQVPGWRLARGNRSMFLPLSLMINKSWKMNKEITESCVHIILRDKIHLVGKRHACEGESSSNTAQGQEKGRAEAQTLKHVCLLAKRWLHFSPRIETLT